MPSAISDMLFEIQHTMIQNNSTSVQRQVILALLCGTTNNQILQERYLIGKKLAAKGRRNLNAGH
jgi:hypothetical protein